MVEAHQSHGALQLAGSVASFLLGYIVCFIVCGFGILDRIGLHKVFAYICQ